MTHAFRLVERLAPNIVGMVGVGIRKDIGRQLWVKSTMRQHRTDRCVNCGRTIGPVGWAPMPSATTGTRNRGDRLCCICVEERGPRRETRNARRET